MTGKYWLSNEQWAVLEPFMTRNQLRRAQQRLGSHVATRSLDSRIVHAHKVRYQRCDCPSAFGPFITVYNQFNCWSGCCRSQRCWPVAIGNPERLSCHGCSRGMSSSQAGAHTGNFKVRSRQAADRVSTSAQAGLSASGRAYHLIKDNRDCLELSQRFPARQKTQPHARPQPLIDQTFCQNHRIMMLTEPEPYSL